MTRCRQRRALSLAERSPLVAIIARGDESPLVKAMRFAEANLLRRAKRTNPPSRCYS